ncbi:hypothetical protein SDC9_174727 [bioreactor metagenome]|uniref:Uncharacterized protein n=1 Tax=bioreactor metagenome TaxID=1076179 RepID=A0A645GM53_9ZZZZ
MSSFERDIEGSSMHMKRSAGAPFFSRSSLIMSTTLPVVFLLFGWGAKISEFLALKPNTPLKRGVASGFVLGMRAAMTPSGFAIFVIPFSGILSIIPTVLTSRTS